VFRSSSNQTPGKELPESGKLDGGMGETRVVSHSDPWDGQVRARIPVKLSNGASVVATIDTEANSVCVDREVFLSTDEVLQTTGIAAQACDGRSVDVFGGVICNWRLRVKRWPCESM